MEQYYRICLAAQMELFKSARRSRRNRYFLNRIFMAKATRQLVEALRKSADRIQSGGAYEWGHVGRCNCGHLVQSVTGKSSSEIIKIFGPDLDEWTEHANDYCGLTGLPVDNMLDELAAIGFDPEDVRNLEYLRDPAVLDHVRNKKHHLRHNDRDDVALYMNAMAEMLDQELVG